MSAPHRTQSSGRQTVDLKRDVCPQFRQLSSPRHRTRPTNFSDRGSSSPTKHPTPKQTDNKQVAMTNTFIKNRNDIYKIPGRTLTQPSRKPYSNRLLYLLSSGSSVSMLDPLPQLNAKRSSASNASRGRRVPLMMYGRQNFLVSGSVKSKPPVQ